MPLTEGDPTGEIKPVERDKTPDAQIVNDFHSNDDLDRSLQAHHHSIGIHRNKVSSGLHNHTGKDSRKVGFQSSLAITGKLTPATVAEADAVVDSLIAMLKNVIDFQDNRT